MGAHVMVRSWRPGPDWIARTVREVLGLQCKVIWRILRVLNYDLFYSLALFSWHYAQCFYFPILLKILPAEFG